MKPFVRRWWPLLLVALGILIAFAVQALAPDVALMVPFPVALFVCVVLVLVFVIGLLRKADRSRLLLLLGALIVAGGFAVFCFAGGPLWLRFDLSRDQLHDAVMRAVQGTPPSTPCRVGMFAVQDIDVDGGVVSFRTHDGKSGEQGIAYFPMRLEGREPYGVLYLPLAWERGYWYVYVRDRGDI
ncbi:MAG: hypothetical protein Q7V53_03330 [Caldisericota bacterium]|nr:hypothetical protein [Caldisericota bacterium]